MTVDYSKLELPLYPGDTIYTVYDGNDDEGDYIILDSKIDKIVISKDNTVQFVVDSFVEDFNPARRNFATKEEAEAYIERLRASLPRHIKRGYVDDYSKWHKPQYYLPEETVEVLLTVLTQGENEPGQAIHAFFIRNDTLLEGFYLVSPSAYDEGFVFSVERLDSTNTVRIPDDRVFAWRYVVNAPTSSVYEGPPLT